MFELEYVIDWNATWTGLAAIAACIAIGATMYALRVQVTEAKKLTSHQLFLQIHGQYESEYMQMKRAILSYQLKSKENNLELDDTVLVFHETLGQLSNMGLLDGKVVWNAFSVDVCSYWSACRHYVEHIRNEFGDKTLFSEFEQLRDILQSMNDKYAPESQVARTPDAISKFLAWEIQRVRSKNHINDLIA